MRNFRWRFLELAHEATIGSLNPRSRYAFLIVIAIFLGLSLGWLSIGERHVFELQLASLNLQGRNVIEFGSVSSDSPAKIEIASCEALNKLPTVTRAGAIRLSGSMDMIQLGPSVPRLFASPSLVPELNKYPIVVGSGLGLSSGSTRLLVPDAGWVNAAVAPVRANGTHLNDAIAERFPPGQEYADTCIVELTRFASVKAQIANLQSQLRSTDGELRGTAAIEDHYDIVAAYSNRPSRFFPLAAGLLGGVFAGVVLAMRSSEIAAYRLSGTSRSDLAALLLLEQIVVAGMFVAAGSLALLVVGLAIGPPQAWDYLSVWVAGTAWIAIYGGAVLIACLRNPVSLARDR